MHNDFNKKKWSLYSYMYNLQNGIQFKTIPTSKTKTTTLNTGTTCLFISLASRCVRVWLQCHRSSLRGRVNDHYLKFVFHCAMNKEYRKYVYETENPLTWFSKCFHIVFLTCVLDFKVLEFAWRVLENKPLPSDCPRKNMLYLSWALSAWATRQ